MILLDTHIWLWFVTGDSKLPSKLTAMIEERHSSDVILSPVSSWEIMVASRKGRIVVQPTAEAFLKDALAAYPFRAAPLTHEIAMLAETLRFTHEDPADHFIAATAHAWNARLLTVDDNLRKLPWLKCAQF